MARMSMNVSRPRPRRGRLVDALAKRADFWDGDRRVDASRRRADGWAMSGVVQAAPHLKRRIGFWLLTLYGVGVMVGAGVYVLIGQVAGEAGELTPLAFLLAGLAAGLTGACFAELSARHPESAGEAAYTEIAFGSSALGAGVGLVVAAVGVVVAAAVLKGGVGYLQTLLPGPAAFWIVALALALGILAGVGVAESLTVAAIFTVVELLGLAAVSASGFWAEGRAAAEAAPITLGAGGAALGVMGGMFLAFFAFLGFESMVNLAEETETPRRTVPRALLAAFLIVTAAYVVVSTAAVRAVDPAALAASDRPLALVFETATGRAAGFIALIAVAAALNGVLAQIVMASRILFGLGRRQKPLEWLYEAHPRLGTPIRATIVATALVILLALVAPLGALASIAVLLLLGVFAVMNLALIQMKRDGPPPPTAPNLPWLLPWAGFSLAGGMLVAWTTAQFL